MLLVAAHHDLCPRSCHSGDVAEGLGATGFSWCALTRSSKPEGLLHGALRANVLRAFAKPLA